MNSEGVVYCDGGRWAMRLSVQLWGNARPIPKQPRIYTDYTDKAEAERQEPPQRHRGTEKAGV